MGLHTPLRPAIDHYEALDGQDCAQQPTLHTHVVQDRPLGITASIERGRHIRGRRRQSIAHHVGDDDESALGIENALRLDQPLRVDALG